jgi:HEAT repeat protein/S1-C subfamily serine protease
LVSGKPSTALRLARIAIFILLVFAGGSLFGFGLFHFLGYDTKEKDGPRGLTRANIEVGKGHDSRRTQEGSATPPSAERLLPPVRLRKEEPSKQKDAVGPKEGTPPPGKENPPRDEAPAQRRAEAPTPPERPAPGNEHPPVPPLPAGAVSPEEKPHTDQRLSGEQVYRRLLRSAVVVLTPEGQGSGALIHLERKLIVTNYHVVGDYDEVKVSFPCYDEDRKLIKDRDYYRRRYKGGKFLVGEVVQVAKGQDLALVKLSSIPDDCRALRLAPEQVSPGQTVHSIGNPGAVEALWAYTSGSVRQVSHKTFTSGGGGRSHPIDAEVVETQSPTNPGDSGGPLVDDFGQLVGVTQGARLDARAVSYFIDVSEVKKLLESHKVPLDEVVGWGPAKAPEADVVRLIGALGDPDAEVRARAARRLGERGPDAGAALEALVKALSDPAGNVRRAAALAVRLVGLPTEGNLDFLLEALKSGQVEARAYASEALGKMGPSARPAAASLVEALSDQAAVVRYNAARALAGLGPAVKGAAFPALVRGLNDPDDDVRAAVQTALDRMKPLKVGDVPPLLALTRDKAAPIDSRVSAIRFLGSIGPDARGRALADLLALLGHKDRSIRTASGDALAQLGDPDKNEVPALVAALADGHGHQAVRCYAAAALGRAGRDVASRPLLRALADPDREIRQAARLALDAVGPLSVSDVPLLLVIVKTEAAKTDARVQAVKCLGGIGADARGQAFADLLDLLGAGEREVREAAAAALKNIGPPGAEEVPVLAAALKHREKPVAVRRHAAAALSELGADARPAVAELAAVFLRDGDSDKVIRLGAARALGKLPADAGALPALLRALDDDEEEISRVAEEALRRQRGALTKDHVMPLAEALAGKADKVRRFAAAALLKLGADARSALPALRKALRDPAEGVRLDVMKTLGKIGPAARDATTDLAPILKDESWFVRTNAALAVVRVDVGLETAGRDAVGVLVKSLKPPSPEAVEDESAKALHAEVCHVLVGVGAPAVETLVKAIQGDFRGGNRLNGENDLNARARFTAVQVLGEIGPTARTTGVQFLLLELIKEDPYGAVREAAKRARIQINKQE